MSVSSMFRFHVEFQGRTLNNQDFLVSEFDEEATVSVSFYRSLNGLRVVSGCCWSNVVYLSSRILNVSLHASKELSSRCTNNILINTISM